MQIAYLIDQIFESLPLKTAVDWPVRAMSAIPTGADLSGVWDRWCVWMLRRLIAGAPAGADMASVAAMASLFERAVAGDEPTDAEWAAEAAEAAWAAEAARAAEAAWAARAAEAARAAWAAEAARAAEAAANELVRILRTAPRYKKCKP